MKKAGLKLWIKAAMAAGIILASSSFTAEASIIYQVNVNTSAIAGTVGNIDLQFNPGGGTSQAALVTISSFSGAIVNGTGITTGGVSGNLPATVTIDNSGGLNDYFQGVTFGTAFSFLLQFSGPAVDSPNGTATSGSSFGLSLYNDAGNTALLTTDPGGFIGTADVNLNGTVTTSTFPPTPGGRPVATFVPATVPEPGTFVLFGVSFLLIGCLSRSRAQSQQNS